MTSDQPQHHHRSSLKQVNKAFKGTTAAKRAESRGKLFKNAVKPGQSLKNLKGLSKANRLNKAALQMESKRESMLQDSRLYSGANGLARLLSFVPLTEGATPDYLLSKLGVTESNFYSEKQKRRFQVLPFIDPKDHISLIDQISLADTVVFILNAASFPSSGSFESSALSIVRSTGISSGIFVILSDCSMAVKKRKELEEAWKNQMSSELPNVETFFTFDINDISCKSDLFWFTLTNVNMKGISWRDMRPYMMIDEASSPDLNSTVITGFVRGNSVNPDQSICIPGVGEFKITSVRLLSSAKASMLQTETLVCYPDPAGPTTKSLVGGQQELPRQEEALADAAMENQAASVKVPAGTSAYQAAWITEGNDGLSGEESINDDHEMNSNSSDCSMEDFEEIDTEDNRKSVKFNESDIPIDFNDMSDLNSHRQGYQKEFPDEIELDELESGKQRLAKYRAVKSLRTSEWDLGENLPDEYSRLSVFQNYKLSRKRALTVHSSPFSIGCKVAIEISGFIPKEVAIGKCSYFMLNHESSVTLLNFTVRRTRGCSDPIHSKERLLMVAGPRRMWINPVFSEHSNHNLHKMLRELPEDGTSVATAYGPVTFDPCPVLIFRNEQLILTGSIISNDPNRVLLKRVTLTGSPFKIHKRIVIVRFMFFNAADVSYFKPVEMISKFHRRGHIKESLGTHGYMKCMFDKQIQHHDTIFMHLFKRVFPKWTTQILNY